MLVGRLRGGAIEAASSKVVAGDKVALPTTADAVDWSVVLVDESVSLELLIEGEHCALRGWVYVAGTTAAAKEDPGVGGWDGNWECRLASGNLGSGELAVVSSTATATVVDGAGVEGGLLGDLDRHGLFGGVYLGVRVRRN